MDDPKTTYVLVDSFSDVDQIRYLFCHNGFQKVWWEYSYKSQSGIKRQIEQEVGSNNVFYTIDYAEWNENLD